MKAWMARSADKSRIRLQLEPFDTILWGLWAIRTGEVSPELWDAIGTTTDTVEVERLHQELWASWA